MKAASIVLRVIVTLAAGWAEWTLIAQPQDFTPHWTILSVVAFLLVVWVVLFMRLRSPFAAIWAFALLVAVTYIMVGLVYGLASDGLPDWTLFPVLGGVTLAWLLLLRIRISDPWEATKRVAHGLVWIWLSLAAASIPAAIFATFVPDLPEVVFSLTLLALSPGVIVLSYYAIRGRWSLTWPLVVLFILAWPLGPLIPFIVMTIGLGKLIIQAIGRGGTLAASELSAPVIAARPRGLVEGVNYE